MSIASSPSTARPPASEIARGPSQLTRRQLNIRLALFAATTTAVTLPVFGRLVSSLEDQRPTALAVVALPLAFAVAIFGLRHEPEPSAAYPARSADVVVAVCLLVPGSAILRFGPSAFGWSADTVRLELIGLPMVVAGFVALTLGSRVLWLTRRAWFLVIGACPLWYSWALPAIEESGLRIGWMAVDAAARSTGVATIVSADLRLVGFADGSMVVVSAVCSGSSSVLGVMLATSSLACVLAGPAMRKVAWVVAAGVLGLAVNALRLVLVTMVGSTWGTEVALGFVHTGAGVVAAAIATVAMLLVAPRFGLGVTPGPPQRALQRISAAAPERLVVGGAATSGIAGGVALLLMAAPVLDRFAGPSSVENTDAAEVIAVLEGRSVGGSDLVVVETEPIEWVRQFYGDSEWRRFLVFDATADAELGAGRSASPVTVDVTTTRTPEAFERLDLAACYGFHGRAVQHRIGVPQLADRPSEEFSFDEGDRTTVVVTWQTRVRGGVQRVAVSQLDGDRDAVIAVAAAVSEATVSTEPAIVAGALE